MNSTLRLDQQKEYVLSKTVIYPLDQGKNLLRQPAEPVQLV